MAQTVPVLELNDVLWDKWWIAPVAFGVALVATPVFRWIAYRRNIVDRPDDLLKPHEKPTAILGGLGICSGLMAGMVAYIATMGEFGDLARSMWTSVRETDLSGLQDNYLWNLVCITAAFLLIMFVGLRDDLRDLSPRHKVIGQVIAALILMVGGVGTNILQVFLMPLRLHPPIWISLPGSAFLCFVVVISTCNATNLLDGLDGLCGGVTAIISLGFLALTVYLATWGHNPGQDETRIAICLAMAGAILGFLPYNVPPATIFMGDSGSMLLGFFVAVMMLMFCQEGTLRWMLASGLIFGLPILDTGLAVVRRVRARVGIFTGDRSHLYDQLVDRGMSVKQVVVLFYVVSIAFAVLGVTAAIALRLRFALIIYAVLFVTSWTIFAVSGMITPKK
jgi:UDP-GlcNAc:undecaprenyl-phosphate GlcNAc-1-phosphate transferase